MRDPALNLHAGPKPRLSILMYHQVGRFQSMRRHRANYCDAGRFTRQMWLLANGGFNVVGLDEALDGLSGARPLPPRAVLLTFDDAYANFVEHALPVLHAYRLPAVVYAISGWVGKRMQWADASEGRVQPELMNAAQLREAQAAGITIGSHGASHRKLAQLAPSQQVRELRESRKTLEDILGQPVEHFCYPFGSFDRSCVRLAGEAGYRSAMTCLRGAATRVDHPLLLPRKAISFGDNLLGFAWKLLFKHRPKPALDVWRRWAADGLDARALESGDDRSDATWEPDAATASGPDRRGRAGGA